MNVLLVNAKNKESPYFHPNIGLAQLSAILEYENKVLVVDYAFISEEIKPIDYYIKTYNPDVVGISVLTTTLSEVKKIISEIRKISNIPIILGGVHATLYYKDLLKENVDYIVVGEAENIISNLVKNAKRNKIPKIIKDKNIVDLNKLPYPNFKNFYGIDKIVIYPILTSRGCPYKCSFCACGLITKKWRSRRPEDCINELKRIKKDYGNIKIYVCDDTPTVDKERFKKFLRLYHKEIKNDIAIYNTRADGIDEELLILLKKCRINRICIGVESANKEVLEFSNKGESIETIKKACKLIKKHKFILDLDFIIGLPKDSFERVKDSIKFFKEVKAEAASISILHPFKDSLVTKQILEEGKIDNELNFNPQFLKGFYCPEPIVEYPYFTKYEMKRAYYLFILKIGDPKLSFKLLPKIYKIAKEYNLEKEFYLWIPKQLRNIIVFNYRNIKRILNIYKQGGISYLIKRYKIHKNKK